MIQDDDLAGGGGALFAIDLLDTVGTPLSTAVECDPDLKPCNPQFNKALSAVTFTCDDDTLQQAWPKSSTGSRCLDPLNPIVFDKKTGVPSTLTVDVQAPNGGPGVVSGEEIRVIFDKILDPAIETIDPIAGKPPGSDKQYTLAEGLVDLLGPDGKSVPFQKYWDPGGSPVNTSDVIFNPFGPAIVIKPDETFATNATYTVVVHTAAIKDKHGKTLVDQFGMPFTDADKKLTFTTTAIGPSAFTPDITTTKTVTPLATGDALSLAFGALVDAASSTAVLQTQDATTKAFSDVPGVTLKVVPAVTPNANTGECQQYGVSVFPVDGSGNPTAWPVGNFFLDLTINAPAIAGVSAPDSFSTAKDDLPVSVTADAKVSNKQSAAVKGETCPPPDAS